MEECACVCELERERELRTWEERGRKCRGREGVVGTSLNPQQNASCWYPGSSCEAVLPAIDRLMWQAVQDSGHHRGSSRKNPHMVVSSSSKSSSSSSSPSPFASAVPQTPGRTMEEVWKDIALGTATPILDSAGHRSPYHHHHPAAAATRHSSMANADLPYLRGMILQDFLARPFGKKAVVQPAEERGHHGATRLPAPPRTSPATVLSLNSGADIHCTDAAPPVRLPSHPSSSSTLTGAPFSAPLGSPCHGIIFPFCSNKKRAPELLLQQQQQLDSSDGPAGGGDRRNKRMIKNRESAARSRARKQAYTNELELEVNHLTEENETLRRQHEELRAKMAAQLTRKKALQRSSTAPF